MNENCKDCIHVKNLEDKIKSLWHVSNELKEEGKGFEKRITELEISKTEHKKDFERIFDAIKEIKGDLTKIANCIEAIQLKGSKTFESLKYEVIKYIVIAGVAAAVAKIM